MSEEEELRSTLISKLLNCELLLSQNKVDKFNIAKRRRNSHRRHLGTEYFSCAYTGDLVEYYKHLVGKLQKAGLIEGKADNV